MATVAAGVTVALVAAPAPASATTAFSAPVFSPPTATALIAGQAAPSAPPVDCSKNSGALTGIAARHVINSSTGSSGGDAWLAGVQSTCRTFTGGSSASIDYSKPAFSAGWIQGTDQAGTLETADCPSGSVVTGLAGRTSARITVLQLMCSTLSVAPDGTVALGTPTPGGSVGGNNGSAANPVSCPTGQMAVGLLGNTGTDLNAVGLECSSVSFPLVTVEPANTSWPKARLVSGSSDTSDQTIEVGGEQLWFKFPVQPDSQVQVTLSGLTNNLDMAVFSDIGQAFTTLTNVQDLTHLSAEAAGAASAPSVYSPSVYSPSVYSPSVYSPSVYSPSVYSPSVYSPSVYSPSVYSPDAFAPSVYSPSVYSPSTDPSSALNPYAFVGGLDATTVAQSFASAQMRSLIAVSANEGTANETVKVPTWNNTGNYYVRVWGRNAALSPFTLSVRTTSGPCGTPLADYAGDPTLSGSAGPSTVIVTDSSRMTIDSGLSSALSSFASRVNGAIVDVSRSAKVNALNAQADSNAACPFAKNLVAQAIRDIVNSYRGPSLKYIVLIGDDAVIPFFRYQDTAGLGPETGYFPPVRDDSASQASLRDDDYLSQDAYGSAVDLTVKGMTLPVPDLAVGRLVETPAEITEALNRYTTSPDPVIRPTSTLATGYDFLADSARSVAGDFAAANQGGTNDTLITPQGAPTSQAWTAADLRNALLNTRHDVTFLAGHFSANSALAADYSTSLLTTDLAASSVDLRNTLVFSAGCHSGYNIVDQDGIPGVTLGLDWAQAFAQKGATLVAGTGYQYGDTDFVAYSEKLYAQFAHDLRYGSGAVAVGAALVQAKQDYLSDLTSVAGIDAKALLEATVFGLPMQGVDFPTGRISPPSTGSSVSASPVTGSSPGAQLGLATASLTVSPTLTQHTATLTNTDAAGSVTAGYLSGPDGVTSQPMAPVLPRASYDVTVPGEVLRGVAVRSATYSDRSGVLPLTSAATTEQSAGHSPFVSLGFYPNLSAVATPNYFDALDSSGGDTLLNVTPAQYRLDQSSSLTDTQRSFSRLGLQLYYSNNTARYGANVPALSAAPTMTDVSAAPSADNSSVQVSARVVGDPSAGIQQVFVTYTGEPGSVLNGTWQSVDLTQDTTDSTLWKGSITVPDNDTGDVRFVVQAVNGVGLVGIADNNGLGFPSTVVPGSLPGATGTALTLDGGVSTAVSYGDKLAVGATLTDRSGNPVSGRLVFFSLGVGGAVARTDASGHASASVAVTVDPGSYRLTASFAGDQTYGPSASGAVGVAVAKRATALALTRASDGSFVLTLTDKAGAPLNAQTVNLVATNSAGTVVAAQSAMTAGDGSARFPSSLGSGGRTMTGWFGSAQTPLTATITSDQTSVDYVGSTSNSLTIPVMTITDSSSGNQTNFGDTATFRVSGLPAGIGTVTFTADGTDLISVPPAADGTATLSTPALLPSATAHTITVTYSGGSGYQGATLSLQHTVGCGTTLTGTIKGSVSVSGSTCIQNATIGSSINVAAGASVAVINSQALQGALSAKGAAEVMVCGSDIGSGINISNSTGLVVVGDSGKLMCAANTIGSQLSLQTNTHGVRALHNTVGNVVDKGNSGLDPYGEATLITDNHL